MGIRVLFVDDEPGIRMTLPKVLELHGYEVRSAATVEEGLQLIASEAFDVLISDLNIGGPGDGFLVVSAMRRRQPHCVNLILTGYPAFETALQAIRAQVDDYLVKPSNIETLVHTIEQKLASRPERKPSRYLRIVELLRQNRNEIVHRTLAAMLRDPELARLPLSDKQRINHLGNMLDELAEQLELPEADRPTPKTLRAAREHGTVRRRHGYKAEMLIQDSRLLQQVIYDVVQENLLRLEVSYVITDLKRMHDALEEQLQHALSAYLELRQQTA